MGGLGVGIVYSSVLERFFAKHGQAVDFIAIDPAYLAGAPSQAASEGLASLHARVAALDVLADRYPLVAHGVGDLEPVARWHGRYDFRWASVLPPRDHDDADGLIERLARMQRQLGCRVVLGHPSRPLPGDSCERVDALCRATGCGLRLDLHELHVHAALRGREPEDMLTASELEHVAEIHIGAPVSAARWRSLASLLPRCPRLRGVVVSADDRELARLGDEGIAA
ncbi:MAG: DUF692 family protein, partial [Myxococcales bacterium]|nr:DUF692 family protein [Myxococcales bacterium]